MVLQNKLTTPAVLDTDGNLRWVGGGLTSSVSPLFDGDAVFVGSSGHGGPVPGSSSSNPSWPKFPRPAR